MPFSAESVEGRGVRQPVPHDAGEFREESEQRKCSLRRYPTRINAQKAGAAERHHTYVRDNPARSILKTEINGILHFLVYPGPR